MKRKTHTSSEAVAVGIFNAVMDTLQDADEIGGPDPADYVRLMHAVAAECIERANNATVEFWPGLEGRLEKSSPGSFTFRWRRGLGDSWVLTVSDLNGNIWTTYEQDFGEDGCPHDDPPLRDRVQTIAIHEAQRLRKGLSELPTE